MTADLSFDHFLKKVCPQRDLDWRKYRRASQRKVLARVHVLGLKDLSDYARYLDMNSEEADLLPNLLHVTVSRFFREKAVWDYLGKITLPEILYRIGSLRPLRVLSVGSCSGEEPYSMALLWKSMLQPEFPGSGIIITALELDQSCLKRALHGFYSGKTLREMHSSLLADWFVSESGGYRLKAEVRQMVQFKKFDLLKNNLPRDQDLIFCRYLVFTYFHGQRRLNMAKKILSAINQKGILVLGQKEELGFQEKTLLNLVSHAPGIYERKY
jgi:chemotaxis protein methyltransferase CheR